jgi:hypothetical protein
MTTPLIKTSIVVFAVSILLVLVLAWKNRPRSNYSQIPKKLWTYWDNPDRIPKTVLLCMESWRKHHPDYEITLLTKKNYKGYVHIPLEIATHPNFHDNPTRFADLVRAYALKEHGGVWLDSSILLKEPLDNWLFPRYAEFSGFYLGVGTKSELPPLLENWFFACNKGSPFMKQWCDEFSQLTQYPTVQHYVDSRKQMGVDMEKIGNPVYLAMHVAAQKVLQLDKYPLESLYLQKAEDGPFRYLADAKWDSEKAVRLACQDKSYQGPIMKIRGAERGHLEAELTNELSNECCGWLD